MSATRRQKKREANSARLNVIPLQAPEDGFKNGSLDELEIPRFMKAVQWPAASKSLKISPRSFLKSFVDVSIVGPTGGHLKILQMKELFIPTPKMIALADLIFSET